MTFIVFAGPSLPPSCRPDGRLFEWRQPAMAGDVLRAIADRPQGIVLIDGRFDDVPAVWHRELLHAIKSNIQVFGAASIGALRAAELRSFGMKGSGRVYRWYARGRIDADDEVALLHGPADLDYAPLSDAMVNIRATLDIAWRRGSIRVDEAVRLLARAKRLHFKDRTFAAIVERRGTERERETLRLVLRHHIDQKRRDALALLRQLLDKPIRASQPRQSWHLNATSNWRRHFAAFAEPRYLQATNSPSMTAMVSEITNSKLRGNRSEACD